MRFEKLGRNELTENIALERISKVCEKVNCEFISFKDGTWNGNETYLLCRCKECGNIFPIKYTNLINEKSCPKCKGGVLKPIEEILKNIENKCSQTNCSFLYFCDKEGNKTEYTNCNTFLKLKCNKCGYEWYTSSYNNFIRKNKHGCKKCAFKIIKEQQKKKIEDVVFTIEKICKDKNLSFLGFENGSYENYSTKLHIKCNKCGYEWFPMYLNFIKKNNCKKCLGLLSLTKNELLEKFKKIHGNKYKYISIPNTTRNTILVIECEKHGIFNQTIDKHLEGQGCPKCNQSHLEKDIEILLTENQVKFEYDKYYDFLNNMQLDFYIPSLNFAIECQGEQHFKPIKYFGGEREFFKRKENDLIKKQLCKECGIKLIYYSNLGINYPYEVYEDKEDILNIIKNEMVQKEKQ